MKSTSGKFNLKLIFLVLFIIFTAVSTLYLYDTWSDYKEKAANYSIKLAESAKAFLQTELIESLDLNASDTEKEEYRKLKDSLKSFKESNEGVRFAYLYTLIDEKIYFMVDSEAAGSEDYSPPGQYYFEATDEVIAPFSEKKNTIAGPITDRWGTWISIFIPVMDEHTQEVTAVLGFDYSASIWSAEIIKHVIHAAVVVLLIFFFLILFYLVILKNQALASLSKKLHDSENLFRTIFEQAPIGI
ncbi:MAG: hypothetical protein PHU65_01650, partial [Actinomycetota bacterium]|nr:hypothetical protein [Actinomycetota bacterium]